MKLNFAVLRLGLILAAAFGALAVPWSGSVSAPAVLSRPQAELVAPQAARLVSPAPAIGDQIAAGAAALTLAAPALEHRIAQAQLKQRELELAQAGASVDPQARAEALLISSDLRGQRRILTSLQASAQALSPDAPFAGEVADVSPHLSQGGWVAAGEALATVLGAQSEVVAYVDEISLPRLAAGASAQFFSGDGVAPPVVLRVAEIDLAPVEDVTDPYLRAEFGGALATLRDEAGRRVPVSARYRVVLRMSDDRAAVRHAARGIVTIEARPEALWRRFWRRAAGVIRREQSW